MRNIKVENTISKLLLYVFSILGSGINYLFQIVLGNELTVDDFGVYNSINSFVTLIIFIYSPLAIYACKCASVEKGKKRSSWLNYKWTIWYIFCLAIALGMILFLFRDIISIFVGVGDLLTWNIVIAIVFLTSIYTLFNSIMQGLEKYAIYGFVGLMMMMTKLGIICCIPTHHKGLNIAVCALLLGFLVATIFSGVALTLSFRRTACSIVQYKPNMLDLYSKVFVSQMIYSFYLNGGEIILVQRINGKEQAGLYSSAAMIAKVSVYIMSIATIIILPKATRVRNDGKNLRKYLKECLLLFGGGALIYNMIIGIYGDRILHFFFSDKYNEANTFLPIASIIALLICFMQITHNFVLATNYLKKYLICQVFSLLVCIIGLWVSGNSTFIFLMFWGCAICMNILIILKDIMKGKIICSGEKNEEIYER